MRYAVAILLYVRPWTTRRTLWPDADKSCVVGVCHLPCPPLRKPRSAVVYSGTIGSTCVGTYGWDTVIVGHVRKKTLVVVPTAINSNIWHWHWLYSCTPTRLRLCKRCGVCDSNMYRRVKPVKFTDFNRTKGHKVTRAVQTSSTRLSSMSLCVCCLWDRTLLSLSFCL